jgi:ABC-type lipoprotein release transport system permease subunit
LGSRIAKQRNLLDYTLRSLNRRRGKNIALLLSFTVVVFFLGSVLLYAQALKNEAFLILKGTPELLVQRTIAGRHELMPLSYGDKILQIRGVTSLTRRLWGYYYDPAVKANYTFMVSDRQPLASGEILIGRGISRSRLVFAGDLLSFRDYRGEPTLFQVKGLLTAESELVSADLILVSEPDFRSFFGVPSPYVTDFALRVGNVRELNTIAFKITTLLPDTRPIARDEILRTYDSIFDWRSGIMVVIFSASVLALSSFLLGFILAYAHVFFTSAGLFEQALKGWAVLYPEFRLTPSIDPHQVVSLFFLTVIPYVAATLIPSWRAAVIDPDTVMRS